MSPLAIAAILGGLVVLIWSADRFVLGAAALARRFGMPPLLIGMLIIGFGTSAPEMIVSALASWQGNSGLALGNAYGSNIVNITLILGLTAVISPIAVQSQVLRRELPVLVGVTLLSIGLLWSLEITRLDAAILLGVFAALVFWSIRQARRAGGDDALGVEVAAHDDPMDPRRALFWTLLGLALLIASSRALVWGAVDIAEALGVSDLVIGLTIVAIGTSLPELASSIAAIRRNEHEIALGNVVGSNLFNTLAVVGIAGAINPFDVPPEVLSRDIPVMTILTLSLLVICYGFRGPGRVNRFEGALLLCAFVGYTAYLISTVATSA